jgi:bifunctional UDP-N-acetylglucosamine pyrophosphorylase/glucosamine-1-phosphate N-acetyltransferase
VSEAAADGTLPPHIVVLAAGAGRRMMSDRPKPLETVFFRPMIHPVLDAATAVSRRSLTVVVGAREMEIRESCRSYGGLSFVRQETPLGTADAVRALESTLSGQDGDALILNADAVQLTPRSLEALVAAHRAAGAGCTVGRGTDPDGEDDVHCIRLSFLFGALRTLEPRGPRREFRLPDAAAALAAQGVVTAEYEFEDPREPAGIDDFEGLWRAEAVLQERRNRDLMRKGVRFQDPRTTVVDPRSRVDRGVTLESGCTVINSVLESGVFVENFCRIVDSEIMPGTRLFQGSTLEESRVGRDCRVGPYAHLRPGTRLDDAVRIGNFVEVKNATLGAGTSAAHLSFIGDAAVGRDVNIGCGFITCNSSGRPLKQRTVIEDGVFIGSATQAIAPVTLGKGSFVATGSSVTDDVPPDSFVISRGRQITKPGYAKKYGKPKPAHAPR